MWRTICKSLDTRRSETVLLRPMTFLLASYQSERISSCEKMHFLRSQTHQTLKHTTELELFAATKLLTCVSIDIPGLLMEPKNGNTAFVVIISRFSKLTKTVPLRTTTAQDNVTAYAAHCSFLYNLPCKLLANNKNPFNFRFLTDVCHILNISSLYTTKYHLQTNGQTEQFNCTLLAALC